MHVQWGHVPQTALYAPSGKIELAIFTACPCKYLSVQADFQALVIIIQQRQITQCATKHLLSQAYFSVHYQFNKFIESSEASFLLWLELLIVWVQLVRTIVQIRLGTSARVSQLVTFILWVVWVALISPVIPISLGLWINNFLTFACHDACQRHWELKKMSGSVTDKCLLLY